MLTIRTQRSLFRSLIALSAAGTLLACGGDAEAPDDEPKIATMRLVIGAQTINISAGGVVTGGPIVIGKTSNTVTATFLRADGSVESLVSPTLFELRGTSSNTAVATFTTAALGGTLVGVANGTTAVSFALFHKVEQHEDFGPFPVAVTVQ